MEYPDHPMPADNPDFPDHLQIARYFDDYVEHFGLAERITFRTEVKGVEPVDGEWEVTIEGPDGGSQVNRYRAVLIANGHHWDPRWPEPPFPGSEEFAGEQIHVHHYREPEILVDKRVLVLGIGNSAVDIAVESSRTAAATFLAMRRGAYVLPKFLGGRPIDEASPAWTTFLPLPLRRVVMSRLLNVAVGDVTDYGLPKPDHKLLEAHPTVSSELLPRLGHGDITVKPNIDRFAGGRTVRFVDGNRGGDRPGLLLHRGTGSPSRSCARRFSRRGTTGCRSSAGWSRSTRPASTSSGSSSRWGRSCRLPRPRRNGSPICWRGGRSCPRTPR